MGFELFITLAGYVALLLWGVRMIRTGVTRSFTPQVRALLAKGSGNRFLALLIGLAVTVVLQSSTATGLIAASFVGRELMTLPTAIAAMLGADVGTTIAAFIFSIDVAWLAPLLILIGVILFMYQGADHMRSRARILIGLGLTLLALRLIGTTSIALRESPQLAEFLNVAEGLPVLLFVIGAIVAWLTHSSLSVVILIMSLAGAGVISLTAAAALVVGANVGGSLAPLVDQMGALPATRRVLLANVLMRGSAAIAVLALVLPWAVRAVQWLAATPAQDVLIFHAGFNLATALIFLPLTGAMAALVRRLIPDPPKSASRSAPRYLDDALLDSPSEAIACATRETLALGDLVAEMLGQSMDVLDRNDGQLLKQIEQADDDVDRLHEAIKLYLVKISRSEMSAEESRRYVEILTFVTNLEHIGDIIDKNLMELAAKKIRTRSAFSKEGFDELKAFHARVLNNLRLSFNILTLHDLQLARKLIAEKQFMRDAERAASESHFARLRAGRPESIESSAIHLDVIRDLKRINGHLTSVAYPLLETAGELLDSRLRTDVEPADAESSRAFSGDLPASIKRKTVT